MNHGLNEINSPPLSNHIIERFVIKELDKKPLIFIVIDNLRYDQWRIIEPSILELYNKEKEIPYFSILPTTTQYSRNSLFQD